MILVIVFLAGTTVMAYILAKRIGEPVKSCAARLRLLAEGDLDTPVKEVHTKDETRVLQDASSHLVGSFNAMIKDMDYMLAEMAGGNLAADTEQAVDMITTASGEQTAVVSQVTVGIDQISNVVQTNSATAEQSTAASEELSGQAEVLKSLAGRFKTSHE